MFTCIPTQDVALTSVFLPRAWVLAETSKQRLQRRACQGPFPLNAIIGNSSSIRKAIPALTNCSPSSLDCCTFSTVAEVAYSHP